MTSIYIKKDPVDIREEYFVWLCEITEIDRGNVSYWNLAKALYDKKFEWFVPNDYNRGYEGKNLREEFCEEFGIDLIYLEDFNEDASMLEVIIGLSIRCENIMSDSVELKMSEWFWKILSNVELDSYDDNHWKWSDVDYILDRIINRTYSRNGSGGLFPLKKSRKDQRKIELWYQMSEYLVENYYGDDLVV